jgi:hypothetical protein
VKHDSTPPESDDGRDEGPGTRNFRWLFAGVAAVVVSGFIAALLTSADSTEPVLQASTSEFADAPNASPPGSSADPVDLADPTVDASPTVDANPPDASPPTLDELDLTGRWAHRTVQTSLTELPVGGEVESRTITHRITDIRHSGESATLEVDVCTSKIDSNTDRIRTRLPEAFIESIPTSERRATLTTRDGLPRLEAARTCSVRGADLDAPSSGELPASSDAPTVVDEDGDGHPGVTVSVEGMIDGDLYLVQRGCDSFRGRIISPNRIRGTVDWTTKQMILESTSMFLGDKPPSRPHPDDQKSFFEMVRVDRETTCADLLQSPDTYFEGSRP